MIAFGWYGGKYSHLDWLLPLLPTSTHYCEPFGGSGAVLINRAPALVETFNDIDGDVANFSRILRDNKEDLLEAIGLTPFSREELRIAVTEPTEKISDLERARRFFVRARQVRTGLAQTASEGRWAHCKLTSRAGMAGAVSRRQQVWIVQGQQRIHVAFGKDDDMQRVEGAGVVIGQDIGRLHHPPHWRSTLNTSSQ